MKRIIILLLICQLFSNFCSSQSDTAYYDGWKQQAQSSFFLFNLSYNFPIEKAVIINSGHGLALDIGLNPGYFISQKCILGLFGGIKWKDSFWRTSFSNEFLNDFNSSFHNNYAGNDSIAVMTLYNAMNGLREGNHRFHDAGFRYGIVLRLPFRWAPSIKIYQTYTTLAYKSSNHGPSCSGPGNGGADHEYIDLQKKLQWGCEAIIYRGHQLIGDGGMKFKTRKLKEPSYRKYIWNIGYISFYIQDEGLRVDKYDYDNGCLTQSYSLAGLTSQTFVDRYKKALSFGFKIGLGIL